jgi:hypothetical protein
MSAIRLTPYVTVVLATGSFGTSSIGGSVGREWSRVAGKNQFSSQGASARVAYAVAGWVCDGNSYSDNEQL